MTHQEINDALARSLLDWNRERRAGQAAAGPPADASCPGPGDPGAAPTPSMQGGAEPAIAAACADAG